ncbi:MAG: YggS family pyridoxal phosphate-dependent enzyme [Burkholderiaceae bacterium]
MNLTEPFEQVRSRIGQACQRFGLTAERAQLLAVSKTFGPQAVLQAIAQGQFHFGENYVQEAVEKRAAVEALLKEKGDANKTPMPTVPTVHWHFIGPLQSNKTRDIAETMDWIHSIDRLKIAQRLIDQRPTRLAPLQACLQVNISKEASKSGVAPGEEAVALALAIAKLDPKGERLVLRGLMAIPEASQDEAQQRHWFAELRKLKKTVNQALAAEGQRELDVLSMGMSADLEAAVAESDPDHGFTWLRVGSALFGSRPLKQPHEKT